MSAHPTPTGSGPGETGLKSTREPRASVRAYPASTCMPKHVMAKTGNGGQVTTVTFWKMKCTQSWGF